VEGSLPLGAVPGTVFGATRSQLVKGESMLLVSDGIVEAQNARGEPFSFDRTRTISNQSADAIARAVQASARKTISPCSPTISTVPLLIIDDLGMRKLPLTAAEELLEIIMRRYERASTLITSNRPVDDCGKLLGDSAAVSAMLDRLLHHGHVLKCGPRSWRTHVGNPGDPQ
jgi:hypothetical protein